MNPKRTTRNVNLKKRDPAHWDNKHAHTRAHTRTRTHTHTHTHTHATHTHKHARTHTHARAHTHYTHTRTNTHTHTHTRTHSHMNTSFLSGVTLICSVSEVTGTIFPVTIIFLNSASHYLFSQCSLHSLPVSLSSLLRV